MSDVGCKSPNQLNSAQLKETGVGQHSVLYPDMGYRFVDLAAVSTVAFGSLVCFCVFFFFFAFAACAVYCGHGVMPIIIHST